MKKSQTVLTVGIMLVVIVVVGVLLAGRNKDDSNGKEETTTSNTTSSTSTSAVAADKVTIQGFAFSPATITVKVGTTVTWTNADDTSHTVTADTTSSDAPDSKTLARNDTYAFTFNKAGTYAYHCTFHPSMRGTVIVTE